jgi:hypothetical protein
MGGSSRCDCSKKTCDFWLKKISPVGKSVMILPLFLALF